MTTKHTPGPWFSRKGQRDGTWKVHDIEDAEGLLLAEAIKSADARLIAAAPDLLAACIEARKVYDDGDCADCGASDGDGHDETCITRVLDAAVAKARGEP